MYHKLVYYTVVVFLLSFWFLFRISPAFAAFSINISPSTISSPDDVITITASASGLQNSTQYLEAGFTKEGESANYFGFTKNQSDEWYQYKSSPTSSDLSSYFYSFTPVGGAWSGQVFTKVDINDSGFKGTGNYTLKLFKYITSSSSNSNAAPVVVNITLTPTPTPTPLPTPTPTTTPTPKPTSTPTPSPSPTPISSAVKPTITLAAASPSGSVLSADTASTSAEINLDLRQPTEEPKNRPTEIVVAGAKNTTLWQFALIGMGFLFLLSGIIYAWKKGLFKKPQPM